MNMKLQNKNFIYNAVYQILLFILPLILTPYISRVLGVNNIGIYSHTYSIIYYFMLLAMLGINNHASRTIAKCSNDHEKLNYQFCSIYYFQIFAFIFSFFIYIIFFIFSKYDYKNILLLQSIFLLSSLFDINWLFFGLEKFKITISRNIIIKLISMILVFWFVKNQNDLWKYVLIMGGSVLASQLYLWLFLRKIIKFVKVSIRDVISNLKPCLILFIPVISYSIYRVMDKTMIGSMINTIELGNYESAEKIISIPISFITALGTVMLPHMSKMSEDSIKKNILSSFELTFFIVLPIIVGLLIVSDNFVSVFFGIGYDKTATIIRLLLISIIFSSIANVVRTNYLIPTKNDKVYVKSTIYGALVNLILNLIFIKKYGAYGACIGTISAEFILMFYQSFLSKKFIDFKKVALIFFKYFAKSVIMGVIVLLIELLLKDGFLKLIIQVVSAIIIYFIINYKYIVYDFFGKK